MEIHHLIWFCLTMTNPECAALHGQVKQWGRGPDRYLSDASCMASAETSANVWWNEKQFKVEYACRKTGEIWDIYVPRRRP